MRKEKKDTRRGAVFENYAIGLINNESNQEERRRFWKVVLIRERSEEAEEKNNEDSNTSQPVAGPVPVQHEHQRRTPAQDPGENRQRDSWSAACLAFAGWRCNMTWNCRIPEN